jgi:gliding motility-associated-like protein
VRKDRAVYIPNAFSPNGDGNNDIFYIHTGQEVASINIFKIYNRWGEVVYELNNFFANAPDQGWDGRFRGDFLNPGVFIYYAEVLFKDGRIELLKGDVMISK